MTEQETQSPGPGQLRFGRSQRILRKQDFDRAFAARNSRYDTVLQLFVVPNGLAHPRLGLVVSRRFGSAVERNRWKRQVREAFRQLQHTWGGIDMVVLPKAGPPVRYLQVASALQSLAAHIQKRPPRVDAKAARPKQDRRRPK